MAYLGDYLGNLLAEITIARMQGDLETVRIAELYATHPLLRTMPVPHVRIPDIELDLPVLVGGVDEPKPGEPPRGGAPSRELRSKFEDVLSAHLVATKVALPKDAREKLSAALEKRLAVRRLPLEVAVGSHQLADELAELASKAIAEGKPEGESEKLSPAEHAQQLSAAARLAFLELRKPPPRVRVLVSSAELREAGTTENVTRIRLKISEQGVEWASVEADGKRRDQLVPE